ncbi:MAG: insulinase family protein [Bacteroidales bacterium]|nr:insulinase family protein [Bacteroidales bacterium]
MKEITLKNGLKVWLDVDRSLPSVFGAVVVRVGAKDCPNTGIAHYFEHIMFKGTQRIGTVDYEAERPWLEKITKAYDEMSAGESAPGQVDPHSEEGDRLEQISQKINELSVKAADYAIPNEYNRLITLYGGSQLNAATGDDYTYYHNSFSPYCLDPWLEIASERFINPVYRLFQSELETVYEEKNMYSDNMSAVAVELVRKHYFGTHPYAYPIIGSTEALKHPSLSQMQTFYQKYYGASNMGLILSGDIDEEGLVAKLERTFGRLPKGTVPKRVKAPVPEHHGETEKVPLPIPMVKGFALVYPGPENGHPDAWKMRLVMTMLTNDSGTGLLDRLTLDHKALITTAGHLDWDDAGILVLLGVPKPPLGTNRGLEKQFRKIIKRLITRDYPTEMFQVARDTLERELLEEIEDPKERTKAMVSAFSHGQSWEDYLLGIQKIKTYTQDDISEVVERYFSGENYLRLVKEFGKQDPERLKQPGYKPLRPKHAGEESEYARNLRDRFGDIEFKGRLVDPKKDVTIIPAEVAPIYYKRLEGNDLVELLLIAHRGKVHDPILEAFDDYIDRASVNSLSRKEFNLRLAQVGASLEVRVKNDETQFFLECRADRLKEAVALLNEFLNHLDADADSYKDVVEGVEVTDKAFDNNVSLVTQAVNQRVLFGEQSDYLRRFSPKEAKQGSAQTMIDAFRKLLTAYRSITYTGPNSLEEVTEAVGLLHLPAVEIPVVDAYHVPMAQDGRVYTFHVPKTRQVSVGVARQLPAFTTPRERVVAMLWAHYFGGGMSSVMFQEMREFRSLGYSAGTQFTMPFMNAELPTSALMMVGTQADKVKEALETLEAIVNNLPMRPLAFESVKSEHLNRINLTFPTLRQLPPRVARMVAKNEERDRHWESMEYGPMVTLDEVAEFHRRVVVPAPRSIILVGDHPDASFLDLPVTALARHEVIKP